MSELKRIEIQEQMNFLADIYYTMTGEEISDEANIPRDSGSEQLRITWRRLNRKLNPPEKRHWWNRKKG